MQGIARIALVVVVVALAGMRLSAQDAASGPGEEQVWTGLELGWRPMKGWQFTASFVMRTSGVFQQVKGGYYYLEARRKLSEHIHVDGLLRYVNTVGRDYFRTELGVRYQQRFGKDVLSFRTAYYHEDGPLYWFGEGPQVADNYWRNRIRYTKDLPKRFRAYMSLESWTRFRYDGTGLRRAAWMGGLRRNLGKGVEVSLSYLYQPEYGQRRPRSMSAVILEGAWDVTKPKKKGRRRTAPRSGANAGDDDGE